MQYTPERLDEIAGIVLGGGESPSHTARELIGWFAAARRGRLVVSSIRRRLKKLGLQTKPDFEYAYIDEPLMFLPRDVKPASTESLPLIAQSEVTVLVGSSGDTDPTYRLGSLESANTKPVSVNSQATLAQAITTMLYHDFSQLPVMQGEREIQGAVSWRSIGRTLALGRSCDTVGDCIEDATVLSSDTSLFAAIPTIVQKEYVFVRDGNRLICGIVTTTDLSLQFLQLAEPFLLLGEIEKHLRRLSDGKFTQVELAAVKDPADPERVVTDLADLTFGEHLRLLEKPERWKALGLPVDRGVFVQHLGEVRDIRNSVMHFDPEGVAPDELERLRSFTRLLASLRQ